MAHIIAATSVVKAILILMHGYGTCSEDFIPIASFIAQKFPNIEIHIVDGYQQVCGPKRRMWFDLESDDPEDWKRDIQEPGNKMRDYINTVLARHPELTKKNVIVSGFSQGAMMSLHVGLKESLGGVIAFSGALVDDSVVKRNDGHTQVLLLHGDSDVVIKLDEMRKSCKALFDSDIKCEMHIEPKLEHAINLKCLNKACDFIGNILSKMDLGLVSANLHTHNKVRDCKLEEECSQKHYLQQR